MLIFLLFVRYYIHMVHVMSPITQDLIEVGFKAEKSSNLY